MNAGPALTVAIISVGIVLVNNIAEDKDPFLPLLAGIIYVWIISLLASFNTDLGTAIASVMLVGVLLNGGGKSPIFKVISAFGKDK